MIVRMNELVQAQTPSVEPPVSRRAGSAMAMLLRKPQRYRFDATVRLLVHAAETAEPGDGVRFRAPVGSAYPGPEVFAVRETGVGKPMVTTPVVGLTGPNGMLPRHYSEILHATVRHRSTTFRDFTELPAQCFVAQFARAGMKYRPHRVREAAHLNQMANRRGGYPETPDPLTQGADGVHRLRHAGAGGAHGGRA